MATSVRVKRGRGRPPKAGGKVAQFDELLRTAPDYVLASLMANIGVKNDLMLLAETSPETLSRDRAEMLRLARPRRAENRSWHLKELMQSRAARLAYLEAEIRKPNRKNFNASRLAKVLKAGGGFPNVTESTLRRDLGKLIKLARSS